MHFMPFPQVVMASVRLPDLNRAPALHLVPTYLAGTSAAILILHSVLSLAAVNGLLKRARIVSEGPPAVPPPGIGKGVILLYRLARLLGCLGLLALSIVSVVEDEDTGRMRLVREALMGLPYLYASLLAFLSISPKNSCHRIIRHVNCVLFGAFCVYAYRDILPLATFTRAPEDRAEGRLLWTKIALLFISGVVVPVFTPGQYIPVDPLHPMAVPNPEQTASIFSFTFYVFLDRIIFRAYREAQLKEEELHPLCDTDASAHLISGSFKYLDSFSGRKSRHHIFFGLMRVFHREFIILACLLVFRVVATFSSPIAMNRLLEYVETKGQDAVVRPWVWILLIFLGPLIGSLGWQCYNFINTRTLVRTEAIMTQLVLAHSLRIRMKAETTAGKHSVANSPAAEAPLPAPVSREGSDAESTSETRVETASPENGESTARSEDDSATVRASTPSIKSTVGKEPAKPAKSEGSLVGRINNLVTTDLGNIVDSRDFLILFIHLPLQLGIGIWFLHSLLGWAVWVGLGSIILLTPVPGFMAKLMQSVQKERMKRTDERVQSVSEAMNVIRMVKLFGWEGKMNDRIADKRDAELKWIRKYRFISLASNIINSIIPIITMALTYGTYTLIMGKPLNASKVFSTITVFDLLRSSMEQITWWLSQLTTGKVSLDRVNEFLKQSELLDAFDEKAAPVLFLVDPLADERIGFRNATFSWSKETDGSDTRSQQEFKLNIDGEVLFERGRINLVVGPTGSGKTSLLMALLGEMHWLSSGPNSWYNLPRGSGVAYAAQESWVLNETIRDNIIFDTPFDEERYKQVLYQCALEPDLALFQAGDKTEVGEKGLTLSGGQKARLTLARAVYSKASILLLDDVLAALDVHTAQWIVEKCFGGDLVKDRTIILVTHNVALARPIAHFVVTLRSDGRIDSQGTIAEVVKHGSQLAAQIREDQEVLDKTQQQINPEAPVAKPADGKLIVSEEIQEGHVSASALKMYLLAMAGQHPFFFFTFFCGGIIFNHISFTLQTWMLGYWASQYDILPAEEVNVVLYLSIFVASVFTTCVTLLILYPFLVFGQLRASKSIHKNLIDSVLSAPLRWLDVTPTSRIIARVTNDVRAVDDSIANLCWPLAIILVALLVKFGAIIIYAPIFFIPGILAGAAGAWIGQIYIAGQLPVKRLKSNTRAPVLAHFGAAIAGLVSIRAFGAESKFSTESLTRIDRYTRAARSFYDLTRWVSTRVDLLGSLFSAALAVYLVYIKPTSAGDLGFSITMAVTFTSMLLWVVRSLNEFEVQCNSLERIQGYIDIEHEKAPTEMGKPPAYWPASGDLRVESLSARYSQDGPKVLHDISFHVKAGERVGIVGRTGSGKSSLTLSLLRCIPTEGSVMYDGLQTSELNLDALRSSITIIPQVPELLSGSLRANLDPFGQYDDAELNYALRAAGLFSLQSEMDEGRITLDSIISIGGSNLSVGQRQIFALARAILRKSKILILDEATSAIDYKTDSIIQNSIRQELLGDVSVITVAHRLQTIMDTDKIMVLDAGRIVEFDAPKELLKIKNGKLRALVDESGDRDALYAMAGAN